jgi:hypothetical protein
MGHVPKIVGSLLMFMIAALTSVAMVVPENLPKQLFLAVVWYLAGAMTVFLTMRKSRARPPNETQPR